MPDICIRVKNQPKLSAPIAGMRGWYDASSRDNFSFSSGDIVSQWNDLSGNAYHATPQADAFDHKPTLDANMLNGMSALHFLGGSNVVDSNNKNLLFTRDTAIRTVFAVFKGSSFLLTDSTTTYDFHRAAADDVNPSAQFFDYASGWSSTNIRDGLIRINRVPYVLTDNMPTAFNNGFNLISLVTLGGVVSNGFNRDRTYHSGEQWHAEMLIYDTALTLLQAIAMEEYLVNKWSLF